ncbi:hypothetical protein F511_08236, partial [Dorcoceras hygrometricum]
FTVELYREAYKDILNPIPTFDMYESNLGLQIVINLPDVRSQPGRRRTQRIPSQVQTRVSKCGRCHRTGHNRCSCKKAMN